MALKATTELPVSVRKVRGGTAEVLLDGVHVGDVWGKKGGWHGGFPGELGAVVTDEYRDQAAVALARAAIASGRWPELAEKFGDEGEGPRRTGARGRKGEPGPCKRFAEGSSQRKRCHRRVRACIRRHTRAGVLRYAAVPICLDLEGRALLGNSGGQLVRPGGRPVPNEYEILERRAAESRRAKKHRTGLGSRRALPEVGDRVRPTAEYAEAWQTPPEQEGVVLARKRHRVLDVVALQIEWVRGREYDDPFDTGEPGWYPAGAVERLRRGRAVQVRRGGGGCPALRRWVAQLQQDLGLDDFLVYDLPNGDLVLSMLVVPKSKRKQGVGTQAMEALVELADHNGRRIWLTPNEKDRILGTTSRARLVRFYRGFGFVENKGRRHDPTQNYSMYRDPR